MNLRETYNTIAEDWHKDHQNDTWWKEGTDLFLSYLKPGARVLDAGCAGGYKTKYIGAKGFAVEGTDLSEEFVKIAQRELPQYSFRQLDIKDVETLEGSFDAIYTSAVLLHIAKKDIPRVLNGFFSKLHNDGYLYIAVKERREGGVEEEIKIEDDYGYSYERFFSYFTKEEMETYLKDADFKIVSEIVAGVANTNWIQIIAQKSQ